MNSAYATSCKEPGSDGLEDDVETLFITSSSDFNEISKDEPLNELLITNRGKSIDSWISDSGTWQFGNDGFVELIFLERPEISTVHSFTLRTDLNFL